jgi:ATP-dependent exoDNAse (exonuclease V) beta subunit
LSGLTIYKASAGSGKTYAITREYIHLLFKDIENYRHILGVTFTNKATAEMKSRIITELDRLAKGLPSGYADDLMKEHNLTQATLKQKAALLLSRILHDYSHFTILTIDSFFQRVIRAFAREIGFYQGFDIELDQERILTAAVEQMIFELDSNPALKDWLVRFAEDKIVAGSSWNFNRDIENIGNEVFKENFKELSDNLVEKITDKAFLENFGKKLDHIKSEFEHEFRKKGADAVTIIRNHELVADDFKGKSRSICNFFEKQAKYEKFDNYDIKDTIRNHYNDVEVWKGNNKAKNFDIDSAFQSGLNAILGDIIRLYDNRYHTYKSAMEVQKHLYVLGVIADLLVYIREYTAGRNLFMISDTAQFLRKLIQDSDAPFIYERTGTFIRHFMIDEFQDTSALQWHNFKPLIINSISEGNKNWVVGDVKQSIYRWRNSDWTILSEKIFNDLKPHEIKVETLQYNWRSSKNIIRFNNSFFGNAIHALLSEVTASQNDEPLEGLDDFERLLTNAYSDFAQFVPETKNTDKGLVNIEFIPKNENKDITFETEALDKLPSIIETIQDHHYSLKDIAILVRTRSEGDLVSEYLLKYQKRLTDSKYKYDILSNDSLLLKNSEVVKWLIAAFTCIASPDDQLNRAFLVYEIKAYLNRPVHPNIVQSGDMLELFSASNHSQRVIDDFFSQADLKQYPVYELCDKVISHFGLAEIKNELPFIQAFQDMLLEYSRKEQGDLFSFLRWWDENQDKRVISMPDDQDAIRLMTFHTAKGLEFKIVIVPFGDWTFMKTGWNSNILWCNTTTDPFSDLSLLPVSLSKGLQNTIFSRDYFREKALSYVDNLNLLYVAFTRAIDALFVTVPEPTKDSIDNNIGNLISNAVKIQGFDPAIQTYPAIHLTEYWNQEENRFVYGTLPQFQGNQVSGNNISLDDIDYPVRSISDVVKQVIPAREYFSEAGEMLKSHINTGKIMHEIFQRIKTVDDIDDALLTVLLEGKIIDEDVEKLSLQIRELINHKQVHKWFSNDWEIHTETGILLKDGSLPRPDRVLTKGNKAVVIDYKFGDSEQDSHHKQVRNYMQHLRQMDYKELEGFLWYVSLGKVVPVSTNPQQGRLF